MSALTDLFTAMANKIRTKTGTQTTYTPSEMVSDGIDDVYDAGVASATTPITPSNASPASMTSGTGYKPTANGYAISSYNNVTPSNSSPVALTSGDIDKMGGNGYAISSYSEIDPSDFSIHAPISSGDIIRFTGNGYAIPTESEIAPSDTNPPFLYGRSHFFNASEFGGYAIESQPTSVTPSSTPTSVSSGDMVYIGGSGVIVDAIPTPTSITPSDSSPAALTANTPVNPTTSGYAIASQPQSVTPSTSGAAFNSGIVNMSSGGYAYSQQPKRVQTGSYTTNASSAVTVSLDFTPSLVIVYSNIDTTTLAFIAISENKGAFSGWNMNNTAAAHNIGTFTWSGNSFTHKAYSSAMGSKTAYYVAIE